MSDWREIDNKLARDLMGWTSETGHWYDPGDPLMLMYLAEEADRIAETTGCPVEENRVWSPHSNIAQAMRVKDAIVGRGVSFRLKSCSGYCYAEFWWPSSKEYASAFGATDAKAITLAALNWIREESKA